MWLDLGRPYQVDCEQQSVAKPGPLHESRGLGQPPDFAVAPAMRIEGHHGNRYHPPRFESLEDLSHGRIAIDDLTQLSNERHSIESRSIEFSLTSSSQNEVNILQAAGVRACFRGTKGPRINIDPDDVAVWTNLLCDARGEAARTASDVRHTHSLREEKAFEDETVDSVYGKAPSDREGDKTEGDEA